MGESVTLNPSSSHKWDELASVFWEPGTNISCFDCPFPTTIPEISTMYTIYVTDDNGCVKEDSVWVRVRRLNGFDAPNIIIPHSTSGNNSFTLYSRYQSIETIEQLAIYDRWGNEVFHKKDLIPGDETSGWNGTFGDQAVATGIYVWIARIVYKNGETEMAAGDVMVGY
ncbi:MAG: gliding motility-associated C-terminal domain-containing protein [Saprospiraceae bacterium]|nr:gliding motility-associated C-terminal domain-containing protein [Saprospiraceae bacterium]